MTKTLFRNLFNGPATLMCPKRKRTFIPITGGSRMLISTSAFSAACAAGVAPPTPLWSTGTASNGRSTASNAVPVIPMAKSVQKMSVYGKSVCSNVNRQSCGNLHSEAGGWDKSVRVRVTICRRGVPGIKACGSRFCWEKT